MSTKPQTNMTKTRRVKNSITFEIFSASDGQFQQGIVSSALSNRGKRLFSIGFVVLLALTLFAFRAAGSADFGIPDQSAAYDRGDAPDDDTTPQYPTLVSNNGAAHQVADGYYLGQCIDAELNGRPAFDARGDDNAVGTHSYGVCAVPGDDEDGVHFRNAAGDDTLLSVCQETTIEVTLTDTQGLGGWLWAWMDFNKDGDWKDAGEQIFGAGASALASPQALSPGQNYLNFTVPCDAVTTDATDPTDVSYFRVRLFQDDTGLADDGSGEAAKGEVEDYAVDVIRLDWGDAPDDKDAPHYPTLAANGGASHAIGAQGSPFMGACVDSELDGQPTSSAAGDDVGAGQATTGSCQSPGDDEDGVTLPSTLLPGSTVAPVTIDLANSPADCLINAWIDFNIDGDWEDVGEQIVVDNLLVAGTQHDLTFFVPGTAVAGDTFARFRCSSAGLPGPTGYAPDGEVEDYPVEIGQRVVDLDWGDAVDPDYPTLLIHSGANHILSSSGPILGVCGDAESDGQPSTSTDGDDVGAGTVVVGGLCFDDEDGVTLPASLTPGDPASELTVSVNASFSDCLLNAWIDFDRDGDWRDPNEQIFTDKSLSGGSHNLTFFTPAVAVAGQTSARFRCSETGGLVPDGPAPNGEVEDYAVLIADQTLDLDWGDAPDGAYATLTASGGANHVVQAGSPYLGDCVDSESDGQPDATATGDDNGAGAITVGTCSNPGADEDGVTFTKPLRPGEISSVELSASAECTLSAYIDFNGDGDWFDSDEILFPDGMLLTAGTTVFDFTVPVDAVAGKTYARFRCSTVGFLPPLGSAPDGEVEDYEVLIAQPQFDFGDLPDNYSTLFGNNGAFHSILATGNPQLGDLLDAEPNGAPTSLSHGDNLIADDDEDGVQTQGVSSWSDGNGDMLVTVNGADACLNVWLDFTDGSGILAYGDGDFEDSYIEGGTTYPEYVVSDLALAQGPDQLISFPLPPMAAHGAEWYMRVRLTPRDASGGCDPIPAFGGSARPDGLATGGEVEDYLVKFSPNAVSVLSVQAEPGSAIILLMLMGSLAVIVVGIAFYRRMSDSCQGDS